jgi:hypothetical protein
MPFAVCCAVVAQRAVVARAVVRPPIRREWY